MLCKKKTAAMSLKLHYKTTQTQVDACLLSEEFSLQRPPALMSADRAVLAT